jgi:hypothetical protein
VHGSRLITADEDRRRLQSYRKSSRSDEVSGLRRTSESKEMNKNTTLVTAFLLVLVGFAFAQDKVSGSTKNVHRKKKLLNQAPVGSLSGSRLSKGGSTKSVHPMKKPLNQAPVGSLSGSRLSKGGSTKSDHPMKKGG